jgi:glycosyltransferase involved in cell wall biosynthesis
MRIVIDLQGAQTASRFRGIGRYTMALTRGILRQAGDHEVWLVLNGALDESVAAIRAGFAGLVPRERIRVFEPPGRVAEMDSRAAPRCRAAEMIREQFIALLEPDVVLVTSLFEGYVDDAVGSVGTFIDGARTAVILYDLIPLLNQDVYLGSPAQRQCYMRKIESLRRAGRLLAISDYAREEALAALDLPPDRIVAISTAVDESFVPAEPTADALDALRRRFGITRPFVMCAPGGYDSRKNLPGLITAYGLLPADLRAGHQLLIASRLTDHDRVQLERHAQSSGLARNELILTGYVSDDMLIALYSAAALFVFPSLHEGFGLPALEAMACGTPVIGSNSTSIPEVIGLDEAMFDPRRPEAIAAKMAEVLGDPAFGARLRTHGRTQAAKFSWDNTARRALRALESLAGTGAPVRPRAREALLQALAAMPALAADDATLLALASSLASLPNPAAPRQLLIDVGGMGDAQAVRDLLQAPPAGMQVVPVFLSAQGGAWHYRHARGQANELPGAGPVADMRVADMRVADVRVADMRTGDILVCPCADRHALEAAVADGLFDHLHRNGITLHLAVDDPLSADLPAWMGSLVALADNAHAGDRAWPAIEALLHARSIA